MPKAGQLQKELQGIASRPYVSSAGSVLEEARKARATAARLGDTRAVEILDQMIEEILREGQEG